jgi:hypothetical protein
VRVALKRGTPTDPTRRVDGGVFIQQGTIAHAASHPSAYVRSRRVTKRNDGRSWPAGTQVCTLVVALWAVIAHTTSADHPAA